MTQVTKGYRFRLYPTRSQKELLVRSFGCGRFVWNALLAQAKEAHEKGEKKGVSGYDFVLRLPELKKQNSFLYEVSNVALQQKALDLGKAYTTFFKNKKGFPKFKKKYGAQSIRLTKDGFRIKGSEFYIAKSKTPIKVVWSRELPSAPSSCTISMTPSGEFYVSFLCECDPTLTNGTDTIGIDLGLTDFAIFSDGTRVSNPRHFVNSQRRLARVQRQHSRKQKGSKNRNKARIKVARLHQHIANQRKDFLHKLTRTLVNENQVLGIESLNVAGMMHNRSLAKHIGDVSWSTFVQYLAYKVVESGHCKMVFMDRFYPSSHLCSTTDLKLDRKLNLSERKWQCPHCNQLHDRDVNAAINIRNRALWCIKEHPDTAPIVIDAYRPMN